MFPFSVECRWTEGFRVQPWRPSCIISGTRTTVWEPLF